MNYSSTLLDAIARYTCTTPENYTLIGTSNRTCTSSGQWSYEPPQCQRQFITNQSCLLLAIEIPSVMDCGQPPVLSVRYLVVTSNGTVPSSVATYSCESGYSLQGSKYRTCDSNGTWTAITFQGCVSK